MPPPDSREHSMSDGERLIYMMWEEVKKQGEQLADVMVAVTTLKSQMQTVNHIIDGPPGSHNGLYRTVKRLEQEFGGITTFKAELLAQAKVEAKKDNETAIQEANARAELAAKKARQAQWVAILISAVGVIASIAINWKG